METLPSFLTASLFSHTSSSQVSSWPQRYNEINSHLTILARSTWFRTLVHEALPCLGFEPNTGVLTWQGSSFQSPALEHCLAASLLAVSRAVQEPEPKEPHRAASAGAGAAAVASAAAVCPQPNDAPEGSGGHGGGSASGSGADTGASGGDVAAVQPILFATVTPSQAADPLRVALQEAILLRLMPPLVACQGAISTGASLLMPTAPPSTAPPAGQPSVGGGGGGTGYGAAGALSPARPALALLCQAAAGLAVADCTADTTACSTAAEGCRTIGCGGGKLLEGLVRLCCEVLRGAAGATTDAAEGGGGGEGGWTLGQAAAPYTLAAVCLYGSGDGGADVATAAAGKSAPCPAPGLPPPLLHRMLEALCPPHCLDRPQQRQRQGRLQAAPLVRQPQVALMLLPALLRCCQVSLPEEEYAAAAARCMAALRGDDGGGSGGSDDDGHHGTAARGLMREAAEAEAVPRGSYGPRRGPPRLMATPAVRELVSALSAIEPHVVAAVRRHPDVANWLLGDLLPAGLLVSGDRPTRVRSLALLRACCLQADRPPPVGGWGRGEWEALADLLHVLEEHMFHLVQPVWSAFMPQLLAAAAAAAGLQQPSAGSEQPPERAAPPAATRTRDGARGNGGGVYRPDAEAASWQLATWLAVPVLKACQHVNVSVRRLGLVFVLQHAVQCDDPDRAVGDEGCEGRRPADWWRHLLDDWLRRQQLQRPAVAEDRGEEEQEWPEAAEASIAQQQEQGGVQVRGPGGEEEQRQAQLRDDGVVPALWLLEQLLPVLEHDKLSWENLPGCSSAQRHGAAVRQLRTALATFLATTMRYLMGGLPPAAAAAATVELQRCGGGTAAAAVVHSCLRFALQGTQRATAAAFVLTALREALSEIAATGSSSSGNGGDAAAAADGFLMSRRQGGNGMGLAALATATVRCTAPPPRAARSLLLNSLLPLLTRQALQHPRDGQLQIRAAVLDLVPCLLDPESVGVTDALDLLAATLPSGSGGPPSVSAAVGADPGSDAGASGVPERDAPWGGAFLNWLAEVLEGQHGQQPTMARWLSERLRVPEPLATAAAPPGATAAADAGGWAAASDGLRLEALAAAMPYLPPRLQLQTLGILRTVAVAEASASSDGDDDGSAGAKLDGGVDSAAALMLLVALRRSYGSLDSRIRGATRRELHSTTLAMAPRLLTDFWRRGFERRTWDGRTAYGALQLVEQMTLAGGADGVEYHATLTATCAGWASMAAGVFAGGDVDVTTLLLDEQLAVLAAACVAHLAARATPMCSAVRGGDGAAADTSAGDTSAADTSAADTSAAAAAAGTTAAAAVSPLALLTIVCDLEPSLDLTPAVASTAAAAASSGVGGFGGGSSTRMVLLPILMELKWRLLAEVLAQILATAVAEVEVGARAATRFGGEGSKGEGGGGREGTAGGGALPWSVRSAVCERALQDLDCAPDAALPYILDTLLVVAPYNEVRHAVSTAAAQVTRFAGDDAASSPQTIRTAALDVDADAAPGAETDASCAVGAGATAATTAATTAAADLAEAIAQLRLLQRIQGAVIAAVRSARRVPPALAVRAPGLACPPQLLMAGCLADAALTATPTPKVGQRGGLSYDHHHHGQGTRQPQGPSTAAAAAETLLAAASAAAAATSAQAVPQLLQYGGSRLALAAAAHLCRRVLQPHPQLQRVLLPPLVNLLAFSAWAPKVDAKGLLGRKFEPHQALPARAAFCAWLEQLDSARHGPFLELLMRALLRAACGCRPGALPPGLADPSPADTATGLERQGAAEGSRLPQQAAAPGHRLEGEAAAAAAGTVATTAAESAAQAAAAPPGAVSDAQEAAPVAWRRGGGVGGGGRGPRGSRTPPGSASLDAGWLSADYSFLLGREASQSSTMNAMKVALWQTICLVTRKLSPGAAGAAARAVWLCLEQPHHHANVRPFMQQALLALLDRWPQGAERLLLPALKKYDTSSYQVCVSLVIIGSLLLRRQAASELPGPLVAPLLEALSPWALHHRHAVRVPVQTILYSLLEKRHQDERLGHKHEGPQQQGSAQGQCAAVTAGGTDVAAVGTPAGGLHPLLDGIRVFLGTNPEQEALRTRQALVDFAGFDLETECSLQGLFGIREEVLSAAAAAGEALEVDPGQPAAWALHTRDRLPIDILRALPAVVRSLGSRKATRAPGGLTKRATTTAATTAAATTATTTTAASRRQRASQTGCAEAGPGAAVVAGAGGDVDEEAGSSSEGADFDGGSEGEGGAGGEGVGEEEGDGEGDEEEGPGRGRRRGAGTAVAAAAAAAASYQLRPQLLPAAGGVAVGPLTASVGAVAERLDALAAAARAELSRPTGLVVVASLLENIPNMAGLCRTCESLGCEALVLPSRTVASSEAFKRQAVTSERWLPLHEVGPRDLAAYLREMRARGYSLVGVEQAAGSVPLERYTFPPRCVLLLGNEQSGVPQSLIGLMDACVEIPMLGVTRSLNAHVSGAMAVWQYVQQQQLQQQ